MSPPDHVILGQDEAMADGIFQLTDIVELDKKGVVLKPYEKF